MLSNKFFDLQNNVVDRNLSSIDRDEFVLRECRRVLINVRMLDKDLKFESMNDTSNIDIRSKHFDVENVNRTFLSNEIDFDTNDKKTIRHSCSMQTRKMSLKIDEIHRNETFDESRRTLQNDIFEDIRWINEENSSLDKFDHR